MGLHFRYLFGLLVAAPFNTALAATTVTYYYTDNQGNILAEADAAGNVLAVRDYKPFGRVASGPISDGPGYSSHIEDSDTKLVYMQARYYDPDLGRFLSVDPQAPTPGSIFFVNRFAYANNAPSRFVDEHGDKPGDKFATPEMAAYDALRFINPRSIAENHEYSGWITIIDHQFVATDPVQMSETGGVTAAPGIPVVGDYHTHGNYSLRDASGNIVVTGDPARDNLNSDSFSGSDVRRYQALARGNIIGGKPTFRGYLATPGNRFLVYDGASKTQVNLVVLVSQQGEQQEIGPPDLPPPPPPRDSGDNHRDVPYH